MLTVGVNLNKACTLYNVIVVCGVQVIIGSTLMKAAPVTQNTSSVTLKTRELVSNQRRKMYVSYLLSFYLNTYINQ